MEQIEDKLEDRLSFSLHNRLVSSLNTNERWKLFTEGLAASRDIYLNVNHGMNREMSPADKLLEELFDRSCSFEVFCVLLREFDLLEELSILIPPEPMVIEIQPGNGANEVRIENGEELKLTCKASGVPRPTFQWYIDNSVIPGQTSCDLIINPFSETNKGIYYCKVRQDIRGYVSERMSSEVFVDLIAVKPTLVMDLPRIRSVARGQTLLLVVQAEGYPEPQFEWYRSNSHLSDGTVDNRAMPNIVLNESSNVVEVKNTGPKDEGLYCCIVKNEAGEAYSSICTVSVFEQPPDYIASAKVALLIGNEKYMDQGLERLDAPSNDVATLSVILEDLGFHVIALHNLTRTEMFNAFRWFCRVLPRNAYAFFYFAGHGFSKLDSKFMIPIDCPWDEIQLDDCLCNEQLMQILAKGERLQLLVMLFDCCRVGLGLRDLSIGKTEFAHDLGNCNIILATATRNHKNAYESMKDANGLFVNQLKHHLADDKPILEVLLENQREFREKKQQPTVFFGGADNCSLRDPVEENLDLEKSLQSEIDFPSFEQEIYFSKTSERFKILIRKHKNCFLNSIDLEFPENFSHNFTVQVNQQGIVELEVERKVVTIRNIQKVKTSMCVTVFINGLRQSDEGFVSGPYDSYVFDLDSPLIKNAQLWDSVSCLESYQSLE